MLYIHFGYMKEACNDPKLYFSNRFLPEWFDDPFIRRICLDVDRVTVHSAYQMEHPTFGPINCRMLSAGCCNCILAYKTDLLLNGTMMRDNCGPILVEIAKSKDVHITLEHLFNFKRCTDFMAHIDNINTDVHSYEEYLYAVIDNELI